MPPSNVSVRQGRRLGRRGENRPSALLPFVFAARGVGMPVKPTSSFGTLARYVRFCYVARRQSCLRFDPSRPTSSRFALFLVLPTVRRFQLALASCPPHANSS